MNTSFCFLAAWRRTDFGAVDVRLEGVYRILDDELHSHGGGEVKDDIGAIHELGDDSVIEDGVDGVVKSGTPFEMGDVLDRAG